MQFAALPRRQYSFELLFTSLDLCIIMTQTTQMNIRCLARQKQQKRTVKEGQSSFWSQDFNPRQIQERELKWAVEDDIRDLKLFSTV